MKKILIPIVLLVNSGLVFATEKSHEHNHKAEPSHTKTMIEQEKTTMSDDKLISKNTDHNHDTGKKTQDSENKLHDHQKTK